jgi:putative heme degradation protein
MRKYLDEKEKHPDLSNRKLAAIMGISEAGIRRLKKKAELWHN